MIGAEHIHTPVETLDKSVIIPAHNLRRALPAQESDYARAVFLLHVLVAQLPAKTLAPDVCGFGFRV